jgi:hypothetical protein
MALSLLGAGAGTALRYGIDGVAYRTFTAPAPHVKEASLAALARMGIEIESTDRFEGGEVIYARCAARNGGFFYDNATASEIVAQTERLLSLGL